MAIRSGFFNSEGGDRRYDARWFAEYFASFIGNGVFPNPSSNLQVFEYQNMQTKVVAGKGWIKGYYLSNDGDYILEHDIADGILSRIDRIVMRLNHTKRMIEVLVLKGSFASNPVPPSITRDANLYDLVLADVYIKAGATEIIQGDITDQRLNNDLCGIVHGTIDQIDTTTLFNQYQSWYEQMTGEKLDEYDAWFAQHQQEFNDWFASIQDILDGNVAGNLLLQIEDNSNKIDDLREYSIHKMDKDADGIFKRVELRRPDGSLYITSVLDNYINQVYTTRTETRYTRDGLTVDKVINYQRVYDSDGVLISEVII